MRGKHKNMATDVILHLQPCSTCGRTFNPDTLARHEAICAKNAHTSTRRKTFDIKKQRLRGTELETYQHTKPMPHVETKYAMAAQKKDNWRRKHEDFIQSIRSARSFNSPGSPRVHQPSAPNPDYVQCNYCNRRFEPTSAERHIPFCREQANRLDRKLSSTGKKGSEKLNKRVAYKPPPLKKKSSTPGSKTPGQATPTRPPGSTLIMQNTNFKNTYVLDKTPPTSSLPPTPSGILKSESGTSKKTRNSLVGVRKPPHNRQATPLSQQTTPRSHMTTPTSHQTTPFSSKTSEELSQQKLKTTSFSRVKREMPAGNFGASSGGNHFDSPNNKHTTSTHVQEIPHDVQVGSSMQPKKSASSQRLLAALEFSDHSSDEGSGQFVEGYHGDKNSRGRHLTQILNEEDGSNNGYTRNNKGRPLSYHTPSDIVRAMVMNAKSDTGRYPSASAVSNGTSSSGSVPLNEFGMPMSKFCYECGTKFPVLQAKYCCECGTKRI